MTDEHDIVSAARGWLGTRFHHQGRLKKTDAHLGGVDCLGLLVGVATELDLRDAEGNALCLLDERDYPHYPDSRYLMTKFESIMQPIAAAAATPGDIALFTIDESPRHLAIISSGSSGLQMIHAYAPARAVVEHALDGWWWQRIKAVYRIL